MRAFGEYRERYIKYERDISNLKEKTDKLKKKGPISYLNKRRKLRHCYEHSMVILYDIERILTFFDITTSERKNDYIFDLQLCCTCLESNIEKMKNLSIELKNEEPKRVSRNIDGKKKK